MNELEIEQLYINKFGKEPPKKGQKFKYVFDNEYSILIFDEIAYDVGSSFFMLDFDDENGNGVRLQDQAIVCGDVVPL